MMSREDGHFRLRIADEEKEFVRQSARRNLRSMTAEINFIIRDRMVREAAGDEGSIKTPAASSNRSGLASAGNVNHGYGASE